MSQSETAWGGWRSERAAWLCAPLLSCMLAQPVLAQPAPNAVHVRMTSDCASMAAEQLLLEEVRMRVPEQTSLQRVESELTRWHLAWEWDAAAGCQLTLSDTEPMIALPLSVNASPKQIREAAVRVAWFITTTQPRLAGPEDLVAPAAPATLPTIPAQQARVGFVQAPGQVLPVIPKAAASQAELVTPSPRAESALKLAPSPAPSVLGSLSGTLSSWRDASPGLLESLHELGTAPPQATLFGRKMPLGGWTELGMESTNFDQRGAILLTAGGGVLLADQFSLGLEYQHLANTVVVDDNWFDDGTVGELDLKQAGMVWRMLFRPEKLLKLSLGGALLGGRLKVTRISVGDVTTQRDLIVSSALRFGGVIDLLPWLQASAQLNYHFPLVLGSSQILTTQEYSGISAGLGLTLRLF